MKVTTEPYYFEIEILKTDKSIPLEKSNDFIEWLKNQSCLGIGKHHEYYNIDNNNEYNSDSEIGITFNIIRKQYN